MIVDVHAHCWPEGSFSEEFIADARRMRASAVSLLTPYDRYRENLPADEDVVTVVFGGKARLSGVWVDDADVAQYVSQAPDRMIGFLSVDPTQPGWEDELRQGREQYGMRGIKLLPMYADFYPQDERLDPLWWYATKHQLPVLLHTGTTFVSSVSISGKDSASSKRSVTAGLLSRARSACERFANSLAFRDEGKIEN